MSNGFKKTPPMNNTVWAIGGGKGGIGKSFISSNLAICLTRMGKQVTLVDLDLGSANLHTILGAKIPQQTLADFISGRSQNINEIVAPTEIPGLSFISGFNDPLTMADLEKSARDRLIQSFKFLPSPYVLLDLGAGTAASTLDFFLAADQKIVAVTPEPTSIENAYRFMKSAFYRHLRQAEAEAGVRNLIESAMESRNQNGIKSPADLLNYVNNVDPQAGLRLMQTIATFRPQIIVNQVRTREDLQLGNSMKSICRKYFNIEAHYAGYLDHDNAVWQTLRKRRPLLVEFPYSGVVGQFLGISKNLLHPQTLRAVI